MYRALWMLIALGCISSICIATEPKPEIVSPLTLVVEQNLIENPKAILKGKVESVFWQKFGVRRSATGESKEVQDESRLSKYDADGHVIEVTERGIVETRQKIIYENGLLVSERGQTFKADGTQVGEEFWQTRQYDADGRLLELKRGRGQRPGDHYVLKYDSSGRLMRQESRLGEQDTLDHTEDFVYSGAPATIERRIVSPKGGTTILTRMRLDQNGNVAELWDKEGFHVAWKYDNQNAVIEQSTDSYKSPGGCDDECPMPGVIRTRYEDHIREQTFFEPDGMAVLKRITLLEQDGSIASIRYQRPFGANPEDAPMLNRIVNAITRPGGERYVETSWDNNGNWIEKRECFRPRAGAPIVEAIYRRKITYR